MPWLIFGIAVVIGLFLVFRGVLGLDPRKAFKLLLWIVIALGGALIALVAIRGGIGYALAAASFILPMFLRWRQVRQYFRNLKGPSAGANSGVETRYLRMSLDHDTGTLDGLVLDGKFRGRRLSELSLEQLVELLGECRVNDPESATVIEAYLDRVHGPDWRTGEAGGDTGKSGKASPWSTAMSREEALEILGLTEGATADDVKRAHREMMMRHHPDQGGSNYFATKLNEAKDLLLRR